MLIFLAILAVAQLGDEATPVSVADFYKENGRRPTIGIDLPDGGIGILPYRGAAGNRGGVHAETHVLQVLTDDSALISFRIFTPYQPDLRVPVVATRHSQTVTVMFKGISTRGVADGDNIAFRGWWKVDGTESYESAVGKRTVRLVRRFRNDETDAIDADLIKKATDQQNEIAKAESDAKAAEEEKVVTARAAKELAEERKRESYRRTWTSKDGKFSVDAYFIDQATGEITLKRASDGKEIKVATTVLSAADIDQARQMKLRKKAER